ncbi:neutral amino acid permease [Fusarium mexicanum]|uniref:Neutral amino acid permease n=1 Tax=Fusarium mexicanum TaxID=751941 RepID=A0A8H5J8Y8_9HYPO|nr:neutral amino acid permease [Fusarium mexicanum]
MNSYNINSTAEEGNDLALTPSQLNKPDNEASLHHDAVFGEISDEGPDYRSVGLIGTAGLMMKTQIGLGVLSIPATFNALGMIPGIICLLAVAVITTWSNWIVGVFKLRHRHVYAIDDAGEMMFGVVGKEFFGFAMWIYWVFVSGAGMLSLSIGLNAVSSHGVCTAVFVAVAAVLGFGLSSIRTLARMSWLAWIGVISIMVSVIMVTIATGVQERPAAAPQNGVWVSDYKLFNKPSFVQAASAICSLISAYGGTPGFFAIVAEMRRPEQYTRALTICQAIVTVTYLTIGCLMYYFCGSYVSSPALGSAGDTIKKASYGVAISGLIVSITLVTHLPSKYMFVRLLRNTKHLASNSAVHWSTWLGCTFIVSIIAYIIASAIPIFYSLISLIGALVGTLLCFQTMGFMWFYDNWEKRAISPRWLSACGWSLFVIASGTLLMAAGTYGSIVDIIDAYKAAGGSGAWSCADNSNSS